MPELLALLAVPVGSGFIWGFIWSLNQSARIDVHDSKLEALEARFDRVNTQLDRIEQLLLDKFAR